MTADTVAAMSLDEATAKNLANAANKARDWTEKRNALIREAVADGAGVREVARAVGLSHPSVLNIIKPRQR